MRLERVDLRTFVWGEYGILETSYKYTSKQLQVCDIWGLKKQK
jgi:hypothetical protein